MSEDKEEAIPILNLEVVSKKGTIPTKMSGSLKIPVGNEDNLELLRTTLQPPTFASNGQTAKDRTEQPNWRVFVDLSSDVLPKPMVVKGKVCHKYVCINALLSFKWSDGYAINDDVVKDAKLRAKIRAHLDSDTQEEIDKYLRRNYIRRCCLLSEQINPGEWLLPIKVGEKSGESPETTDPVTGDPSRNAGDESGKLLAYVKVKIVDQIDEPPEEPKNETAKA
jgi:hypothetical protein